MRRRLRTQDRLRPNDPSIGTLLCPLCNTQPDSHDHLFFECVYSFQVWDSLKVFAGLTDIPSSLENVVHHLAPMASSRSVRSVVSKLLLAATSYFIWQERNNRIFKQQRRSESQVIDVIKATVRLKLLTCRLKRRASVLSFLHVWRVPSSLMHS